MISKNGLSVEYLCKVLASAGLDFSVNSDGHIYIKRGLDFPMWIDLHTELSAIRIFTYAPFKARQFDDAAGLALANRMNMNFVPNQVYYLDGCIYGGYTILAYHDISDDLFLKTLRHCAEAFVIAAQECDEDGLFRDSAPN